MARDGLRLRLPDRRLRLWRQCGRLAPGEGVCDRQGRVFHYRNLLICDGSILAANLGVNPALTITALAEYIMSHIPDAARQCEEAREGVRPA
jgi:choline dehydrogenase-like flavoprotein